MSNRLEELHGQYKRHILKKTLKALSLVAFSAFVLGVIYIATISQQDESPLKKEALAVKTDAKKSDKSPEAYALKVSSDELDAAVEKLKKRPIAKDRSPQKTQVKASVEKPVMKELVPEVKSKTNYFANIDEEHSLDTWIEKYNQKKSYSTAVYISKQYYADKNYKQAGIWAKRANQLDRNKEEAWLYYAKSVYALGNVTKAKRILNIYLQYKKSVKAELLLSEWGE